jgi:hypothetical protein
MKRNALVQKIFSVSDSDIGTGSWKAKMTRPPQKNEEISCFEWLYVFGRLEAVQAVLQIQDVYTGSRIRLFHSGSRIDKIPDSGSGSASKHKVLLTEKTYTKFSKIRSGMFIPDPWIFSVPDLGSRSKRSNGSQDSQQFEFFLP